MLFSSTKKMRAVPAIFACCALACTLMASGCGQSFSDAAQALNDGVRADMAQLTDVNPLDVYGPMFSSLAYEVSSISIENNAAHVVVNVSNKDLNQVFQDYTSQVTNELATAETRNTLAAMDDAALTAHLASVLTSCLANPDVPVVSQTVELVYVKDGALWELQDSDELVRALLGGLDPAQASVASQDKLVAASEQAAPAADAAPADAEAQPADAGEEAAAPVDAEGQGAAEPVQQ